MPGLRKSKRSTFLDNMSEIKELTTKLYTASDIYAKLIEQNKITMSMDYFTKLYGRYVKPRIKYKITPVNLSPEPIEVPVIHDPTKMAEGILQDAQEETEKKQPPWVKNKDTELLAIAAESSETKSFSELYNHNPTKKQEGE